MGLKDLLLPSPDAIVREHGPRVHALLRRLFGARADVDDVFQNVFVEVLRSLPRFQGRAKLSTWIHRVALNVAYQEMRQQYGRAHVVALLEDVTASIDVHADVARVEAARRVHVALAALPPKQRLAVALHDLEGMTLKAIAEDLGLPLQTVASQVRVGRARLAEALVDLHSCDATTTVTTLPSLALVSTKSGEDA